jgi:hypothetical protein
VTTTSTTSPTPTTTADAEVPTSTEPDPDEGTSDVGSNVASSTVAPAIVIPSANSGSGSDDATSGGNANPTVTIIRDVSSSGSNPAAIWAIIGGVNVLVLSFAMYKGVFRRTHDNFDPTEAA